MTLCSSMISLSFSAVFLVLEGQLGLALAADVDQFAVRVAQAAPPEDSVHPFFRHSLMIQGGVAFNFMDSTMGVGTEGGVAGSTISLENDLRFPSSQVGFDGLVHYRFADRWNLEFEYFGIPRSSAASVARTFQFGHYSFDASAGVNADFDIQSYRLATGYSFYKSRNAELGAALSLYVTDFSAGLRGSASLGVGGPYSFQSQRFHVVAPLPTIGLYGSYAFSPKWLATGHIDYMDLSLSNVDLFGVSMKHVGGSVFSVEGGLEYRLTENVGVGGGLRYMDVQVDATTSGLKGGLGYSAWSPMVFLRASF